MKVSSGLGLIASRLVLGSFFLLATILFYFLGEISPSSVKVMPFYLLLAFNFFLSIVYLLVYKRYAFSKRFIYIQHFIDCFIITFFIFLTGGSESFFTILYHLIIISAGFYIGSNGAYFFASQSSILYGALLVLQYHDLLSPEYFWIGEAVVFDRNALFYILLIRIVSFFLIAKLISILAVRIKIAEDGIKDKEIDIKKLKELHSIIVDNIQTGVILTDNKDRITFINKAGEKILGVNLIKSYGMDIKSLLNFVPFTEEENYRNEIEFKRDDGRKIILGYSYYPIRGYEGAFGKIAIFQDLTKEKERERELLMKEKLAEFGRMTAGLAHEIKTPISAISGAAEYLKKRVLDSDTKRMCDILINESFRISSMIDTFLSFVRMPVYEKCETNIMELFEEVLNLIRSSGRLNGIKVVKKISPDLTHIKIITPLAKQMLINIINNSVEAIRENGRIDIEAWGEADYIKIMIKDNGVGIPDEIKTIIFDPFFTTKENGIGLGLFIVKRIVDLHKGSINIESTPGGGTTVLITLPK